ncbi:hypothetical protein KIN20_026753 [Parelaphostrongylus tenuis]|uniref:Uncharacterized protein n=1 Tax=Parelaphostrongylus tenuis TaxID=148309 RepID=A0AAD5QYF6_PARTN|nr:hypothetical protein KIN20_026753 [Parelaphostrongylus tenuis]
MQTIYDVLQQQGRVVLLPDVIISAILDQLSLRISYNPLECKEVTANPSGNYSTRRMENAGFTVKN